MKYKVYQVLLQVGGWLSLLAPITIFFYNNRNKYFVYQDVYGKLSVGAGVILGVTMVVLIALKKAHFGLPLWIAILALIVTFLRSILGDFELILWILCGSVCGDKYLFTPIANYYKKVFDMNLSAKINAKAMGNVFIPPQPQETKPTRVYNGRG